MIHLRLSPYNSKTFCRAPAISLSTPDDADGIVEDPLKADCVECLGEAVAFHEMHAKYAEDRLKVLAAQRFAADSKAAARSCPDSCSKGCQFNPCRKPYAP